MLETLRTLPNLIGLTWTGFLGLYALAGWLVFGLMVWYRQVTPQNRTATTLYCLTLWWLALLVQAISWVAGLAMWVFNPDAGPLAFIVHMTAAAATPVELPPPPPTAASELKP